MSGGVFLGEFLAISSELSMTPLLERVLSRRKILGAAELAMKLRLETRCRKGFIPLIL